LLGVLLERSEHAPAGAVAELVAQHAAGFGLHDATIYLQDFEHELLLSLPRPDVADRAEPIEGSAAGQAFTTEVIVEQRLGTGRRLWVPLLGGERVGVLAATVPDGVAVEHAVLRRLGRLVADLLVVKGAYSDQFFLARRRRPMALAAEMQWQLLPPLTLTSPHAVVAGMLSPAYEVGGDGFDYALNEQTLHVAIVDAMGHGLQAAILAGAVVGAYRHARRAGVSLRDTYAVMDEVVRGQFSDEHFATAHLAELDVSSGLLRWVNAGHPRPLIIRGHRVHDSLRTEPTLPVGLGGHTPPVTETQLKPGERILFFIDGVTEERSADGSELGVSGLVELLEQIEADQVSVEESVRRLNREMLAARGGKTADDCTLVLLEWLPART
jgi:hypothetical protein